MKTILYKQGNIEYTFGDGIGAWAKSRETVTINVGDVRLIKGVLMSAYKVYDTMFIKALFTGEGRDEVWWTPVDENFNTYENLRAWRNRD